MMADAYVVNDEAFLLGLAADTIHTGDSLQKIVGYDDLVEIHDLLYRCIEPVSSMLWTTRIPMSPVIPSSSLPKSILKLLMLASCLDLSE